MNRSTNRNSSTAMATIESLEERLSLLLQQLDSATAGQSASLGNEVASSGLDGRGEVGELAGPNSQLLERMEQIVLAANSSTTVNTAERATREELRALSQWLERNFANVADRTPINESLLATWQSQLNRMEQQLENLRAAVSTPARFE